MMFSSFANPSSGRGLFGTEDDDDLVPQFDDSPPILPSEIHYLEPARTASQALGNFYQKVFIPIFGDSCDLTNPNCVFSSFSVFRMLALLLSGVVGPTAEEISRALCVSETLVNELDRLLASKREEAHDPNLVFGEGLFVNSSCRVQESFSTLVNSRYQARLESVAFPEGTAWINSYVNRVTHGSVSNIVPSALGQETGTVVVSVGTFYQKWERGFDPSCTMLTCPFRTYVRRRARCVMMNRYGETKVYGTHELGTGSGSTVSCESCLLPFAGGKLCMLFLKPKAGNLKAVFDEFLVAVSKDSKLMLKIRRESTLTKLGRLWIPKFALETHVEMVPLLRQLGIKRAFVSDTDAADFSKMLDEGSTHVSRLIHRVRLNIDEAGISQPNSDGSESDEEEEQEDVVDFVLDSPFIFFVLTALARTIVFSGVVRLPRI